MSKTYKQTYDVTMDAVNDTLSRIKTFYAAHPDPQNGDSVAFYFKVFTEQLVKGWRDIEYLRHAYDYNRQMSQHSDKSPSTLQRIYNKK